VRYEDLAADPAGVTRGILQRAAAPCLRVRLGPRRAGHQHVGAASGCVTDTGAVLASLPGTDLRWLQSPTNPLLGIADLPRIVPPQLAVASA
jgi:hypothetical protein